VAETNGEKKGRLAAGKRRRGSESIQATNIAMAEAACAGGAAQEIVAATFCVYAHEREGTACVY
jgi:hypothetical protein